jgi:hypothetical protein
MLPASPRPNQPSWHHAFSGVAAVEWHCSAPSSAGLDEGDDPAGTTRIAYALNGPE